MTHQKYTWYTGDRKKMFAQSWTAEEDRKILVLLVHGLGEHSSRYEPWAGYFNQRGISFLTMDLHGHGRSEGKKGHIRSLEILLDDIDLLWSKADDLFPDYKKILYGHSMGGNLVLNYIIRRAKLPDALIVTSPWIKLFDEPSPNLLLLTKKLQKILPSLTISNRLKAEQISHDPEVVKNYEKDPLNHDRISLTMFHELYEGSYNILRNIHKINAPLLLMHGSGDTITSPAACEMFDSFTSRQTTVKIWPGQFHELHNEFIREEVHTFIISWLEEFLT